MNSVFTFQKQQRLCSVGIAISLLVSGCAPFQLNLPGSCAIFFHPEKTQQPPEKATAENKKKKDV